MIARAFVFGGLVAGVTFACSLDLDESLIDGRADGGVLGPDGSVPDGVASDGSVDAGGATPCTTDDQCKASDACLTGTCDQLRKRCVYDLCRPKACGIATCDMGAHTCGASAPYKFVAGQFPLGAISAPAHSVAVIHPYLFAATAGGLRVFEISNPTNGEPRLVPVTGLGFIPSQVVATQDRIWLRGNHAGPGPSRMPIAWIDPPSDPYAATLTAHTVLTTYDRPASEGASLFARPGSGAVIVGAPEAALPSVILDAPLAEPVTLTSVKTSLAPNASSTSSGMSGNRLLVSTTAAETTAFSLVNDIGTPTQKEGGTAAIAATRTSTSQSSGSSPDGGIFWMAGVHVGVAPDVLTRALRGYFVTANDAAPLATDALVDVEAYPAALALMPNVGVAGPVALVDAKTAVVTAAAAEAPTQSAVEVVTREPLAVNAARRTVLPVPITAFTSATSSHGLVYIVANVPPPPASTAGPTGTVFVFDPGCDR